MTLKSGWEEGTEIIVVSVGEGMATDRLLAEPCPFPMSSLEICICLERVALQPVSKTMGGSHQSESWGS